MGRGEGTREEKGGDERGKEEREGEGREGKERGRGGKGKREGREREGKEGIGEGDGRRREGKGEEREGAGRDKEEGVNNTPTEPQKPKIQHNIRPQRSFLVRLQPLRYVQAETPIFFYTLFKNSTPTRTHRQLSLKLIGSCQIRSKLIDR